LRIKCKFAKIRPTRINPEQFNLLNEVKINGVTT